MADPAEIANRYFEALDDHDLDAAGSLWAESGVDRVVGQREVGAPAGVREYFKELFDGHAEPVTGDVVARLERAAAAAPA